MRVALALAALCPLLAVADDRQACVEPARRIELVNETCTSARPVDCIPDLVLAIRTGTATQATTAAGLLLSQRSVALAMGWAIAAPIVAAPIADRLAAALEKDCKGGDVVACRIREDARAQRSGAVAAVIPAPGTLAAAQVATTVKRYLPLAERCYTRHLACHPGARGTVRLDLRVAANGNVAAAQLETGLTPDIDACVLATVSRWRFAAPTGGEARVRFPLVFAAGD